ncbi:MAG TPA: DUF3093 domain-containing protein [Microbacteriaceae bacterium]|nr:DUF3093 domain-containing protein [Microbacteriaceae bacterium]
MVLYRERLWATPWLYVATALIIPACLLVFAPINPIVGVASAVILYGACVWLLVATAPTIEVTETTLCAGRAQIQRSFLGIARAYRDEEATLARGQKLDARAWLLIRGWVKPVVSVEVRDENDPAPYWLLSSRHPDELAKILNSRG